MDEEIFVRCSVVRLELVLAAPWPVVCEVVGELVRWFAADPDRLDEDLRADYAAAVDDAERLRVVIDQVASLTDGRALALVTAGS